jgi:putative acetyltransferase
MKIEIRSAEPSDCEAIRRIFDGPNAVAGTLQVPHASVESWRKLQLEQAPNARILVALVKGRIVGHLGLHPVARPRRAHVAAIGMAVSDRWQGRGIGGALLREAISLADNWLNILRLELTVYTDNAAGIRLYKKFGFCHRGHASSLRAS